MITVIELITGTLRLLNICDSNQAPSAEQGISTLHMLNELMADWEQHGIRLGWYPIADADIANDAPLAEQDIRGVKLCLAIEVAPYFGIQPIPRLEQNAMEAYANIAKRAIEYYEADLSMLPSSDSGYSGTYGPMFRNS